ncbi:uracil-DNA glycosylase [Thomasclavelia sp.]
MRFKDIVAVEFEQDYYKKLHQFVENEYTHKTIFPPRQNIFRALNLCDYEDVKVVILGQDPYHELHQANGLAFSVYPGVRIPPSLVNIYKELSDDVKTFIPNNGDLTKWAKQGVLLLNNVLTVEQGRANSHAGIGWEIFTLNIVKALNKREKPMVFILWGNNARSKKQFIDTSRHLVLESAHPSPLSAHRGFFGSRPFSKTNEFLIKNNMTPIDWQIENIK